MLKKTILELLAKHMSTNTHKLFSIGLFLLFFLSLN